MSDLRYQNRVPSRLARPRDMNRLIANALVGRLDTAHARPDTDVLLAQFAIPYGLAVRHAASERGLRYAVHLRGDDVWVWPHERSRGIETFRHVVNDAALVLAVSASILDEARRISDLPLASSAVVSNGIDLNLMAPASPAARYAARIELGIPGRALVVLCVANAIVRKGWLDLLDALNLVDAHDVVLIGASVSAPELDLEVECARRAPRVRVALFRDLPQPRLAKLYQVADVFALASHGEGLSNALLEAMASGLPVVATEVGGHGEVIRHAETGQLVRAGDVRDLAAALQMLLRSPNERTRLGAAARRRAERIGTPAQNGARVAAMLDRVRRGVPTDPGIDYLAVDADGLEGARESPR